MRRRKEAPSVLFRPSSSYPAATPALITCTPQELSRQGEPTPAQDTQDFYLHHLASQQVFRGCFLLRQFYHVLFGKVLLKESLKCQMNQVRLILYDVICGQQ